MTPPGTDETGHTEGNADDATATRTDTDLGTDTDFGSGTATAAAHVTVQVAGLTVRHRRTVALDGVDLSFGPGVHGLLGPNGAGKTSLIRVLATVARPAAGRVAILGHDLSGHRGLTAARRRLGYLPQDFGYYPGFTVREFVAYVAWLKEMPGSSAASAVERAVARVGLADRADAKMRTLSGGMVRRAGIAQAIVNDPAVLLLDEPTAGLDPEQRVALRTLLRQLGGESTVIVSTHLVEDVAAACGEVTLVSDGQVAYRGTPDTLAALGATTMTNTNTAPTTKTSTNTTTSTANTAITAATGTHDAALGEVDGLEGSPLERGYTVALRRHRNRHAHDHAYDRGPGRDRDGRRAGAAGASREGGGRR